MLFVSCAEKVQDNTVSVIPQPMFMRVDDGLFNINKDTKLLIDQPSEEMLRIAGFLNEKLAKAAGFELELITDGPMPKANVIAFMNAGMPSEEYVINVTPNMVLVDYGDGAGAFYALQTIFQPPKLKQNKKEHTLSLKQAKIFLNKVTSSVQEVMFFIFL